MKYFVTYSVQIEAENEKKLMQKLSLIEHQMKIRDKHYQREVEDETGWNYLSYKR